MTETVIEREWTCPTCDQEFVRIARHWGTTCPYPEIGDELRAVCDGLMLGRASADGDETTRLRIWTTNETLARWTFEQLGWLAASVRRRPADDHSWGDRDRYRVETLSHPDCERYRRWGPTQIERLAWSPLLGRVWYAHAGTLIHGEGGRPVIIFRSDDDKHRAAIADLLERGGYESAVGDETVTLSQTTTAAFLNELGEPVTGVAHKWATDRRVAAACRDEQPLAGVDDRTARYQALLSITADVLGVSRELSQKEFDTAFGGVSAATVADWLGGGSWDDAKRVAGLQETPNRPSRRGDPLTELQQRESNRESENSERPNPTRDGRASGPVSVYDERAREHALRRVASHLDTDKLSIDAYEAARWNVEPTAAVIIGHAERWSTALNAVGLEPGDLGPKSANHASPITDEKCERALARYLDVPDGRATMSGYDRWRAEDGDDWPHSDTIARRLGAGNWTDAVESVRDRSSSG